MKIKSSPDLLAFYKAWLAWAEKDAPHLNVFSQSHGLCSNLDLFCEHSGPIDEMNVQFTSAGLDNFHPFGYYDYVHHRICATMHLDPNRLAWVKARIADMEDPT